MKKKSVFNGLLARYYLKKLCLMMRLMTFMVLVSVFVANANTASSQSGKLNLTFEKASMTEVFEQLEKELNIGFLLPASVMNDNRKISLSFKDASVESILEQVLDSKNYSYEFVGKNIVITQLRSVQQNIKLTGKVTDTSGQPLPGVTVVVKGTTNGTITNFDGVYSLLEVPSDGIVQFSFVGMKMQEIPVEGKASIDVVMEEDAIGIEEVVAIGYGTMKKSDLTGSVASVKSEDFNNANPVGGLTQALAGRTSGVQIMQNNGSPGGSVSVRIRGTNSIKGSNEPLYIIDGFPSTGASYDVSDYESVEILKDASATAIYGSRGANGVILITTKKGKAGRTKVEYESSYGVQQLNHKIDLMNATEYATLYNELADNIGVNPYFTQNEINSLGNGTDWQDVVFRNAPLHENRLSISGGTEKTQFIISGGESSQEGIIEGSSYKSYSIRANINHQISDKFKVDFSASLGQNIRKGRDSSKSNAGSSLIGSTFFAPPTLSPYNEDGSVHQLNTTYSFVNTNLTSPLFWIEETSDIDKSNNLRSHIEFLYEPIKGLVIRVAGNAGNTNFRNDYYITNDFIGLSTPGTVSVSTYQSQFLSNENTISYSKTFDDIHKINAVAGITCEQSKYESLAASGSGFISDVFETYKLQAAGSFGTPSTGYSKSTLLSYLGRMNYSYKDRYLFTLSMRADGSSKFSEGQKWGYFPSGAFAWRVSDESFMEDIDFISDLKFRLGWGQTGSQAINTYATQVLLSSGKTVFDDSYATYFSPSTTYPGDLKWETTEQTDIGLDVGLLENRIHFTADYYYKKTTDLLNSVTLPSSQGWTSTIKNVGSIENKGFEFEVDARILDNSNFKWDVSGNISFNRSNVLKLYDGEDITGSTINITFINDYINILREGHPFGEFYGYVEDGYDDDGQIKYKDLNDDGAINTSDKTFIGDPNPDFIYGFNSIMSFHDFELSLFFQGSQGNDIFNLSSVESTLEYLYGPNMLRDVYLDHWTPSNTDAKYPAVSKHSSGRVSDRFVEDGSYLRLRNIMLAYNLPVKKYNISWLNNLQVYVSGENLITFTKYSWWDPCVNSYGSSTSINQGIDHYVYPSSKTVICGIKVKF